jgi:hypothetical protein
MDEINLTFNVTTCALTIDVAQTQNLVLSVPGIQGPPGNSSWLVTPTVITSSTYTVNLGNYNYILCDCTTNNMIITLPATTGLTGQSVIIKRLDGSANTILIQDISASFIYRQWDQGEALQVVVGNGQWLIS